MKIKQVFGIGLLSLAAVLPANAAIVTLTDPGSTFDLRYESTLVGLFGVPTLFSNNITFSPSNFKAEAHPTIAPVSQTTSSTIHMFLDIKPGKEFSAINIVERGDYRVRETLGSFAEVTVGGQIRVHDVLSPVLSEATDFLNVTSGVFIEDFALHNWEADAGVDTTSSNWYLGKTVRLTIENVLSASAQAFPDDAFIEKKLVNGLTLTVAGAPVPVPAAVWLFGSALIGLVGVRRKV